MWRDAKRPISRAERDEDGVRVVDLRKGLYPYNILINKIKLLTVNSPLVILKGFTQKDPWLTQSICCYIE